MKLAPIMVRSQALETPAFHRQHIPKLPALPQKQQREGLHIAFDVDKTLTRAYMQDLHLLPALGFEIPNNFWRDIPLGAGSVTIYMEQFKKIANEKNLHDVLSPAKLQEFGKKIPMAPGATTFIPRLRKFAKENNLIVPKFHFISSGLEEMIIGNPIAKHAQSLHANQFNYNERGHLIGLKRVIEDHDKPQYIQKLLGEGQLLAYVGDGETDKKSWELTKNLDGDSVVVHDPNDPANKTKANAYLEQGIVHASLPRDYRKNTPMDRYLKGLIVTESLKAESKSKLFA